MLGIFSKVRTIALSNIHTVLDKTIDLNDIGAVTQHIRDLESANADMAGSLAEAKFDASSKAKNLEMHRTHASELEGNIKLLMDNNGNTPTDQQRASARNLAVELAGLRTQISAEEALLKGAQDNIDKLFAAAARTNNIEAQMKNQLGVLRAQDSSTKAAEKAAKAISAVSSVTETSSSIDNITEQMGRRQARADAALDRSLGTLGVSNATSDTAADAILAELTNKS